VVRFAYNITIRKRVHSSLHYSHSILSLAQINDQRSIHLIKNIVLKPPKNMVMSFKRMTQFTIPKN